MAQTARDLRRDLESQRARISHTVDEIENRVVPGRMMARRRYAMRQRLSGLRDRVMGHDDDYYGMAYGSPYASGSWTTEAAARYGGHVEQDEGRGIRDQAGHVAEMARERASEAGDLVREAPEMVRQQAQGAPLPAGLVAASVGLLVGSLLPSSRKEERMARKIEPQLEQAATGAASLGREMVEDMKEPAQQAVEDVKSTASEAGQTIQQEARDAAQQASHEARG